MSRKFPRMTAEEFKDHREAIGTQEEVSELTETDRRTIGRWERGERPVPGIASVCIRLLRAQANARRARTLAAAAEMQQAEHA